MRTLEVLSLPGDLNNNVFVYLSTHKELAQPPKSNACLQEYSLQSSRWLKLLLSIVAVSLSKGTIINVFFSNIHGTNLCFWWFNMFLSCVNVFRAVCSILNVRVATDAICLLARQKVIQTLPNLNSRSRKKTDLQASTRSFWSGSKFCSYTLFWCEDSHMLFALIFDSNKYKR